MKIPKEYSLLFIIGLFVLAYILDLIVEPLNLTLTSPYKFFQPEYMSAFPFSTMSVFIKAIALFSTPLWLLSFFESKGFAKPAILLVWSALTQLYAIQDLNAKSELIPIEWSLSLSAAGLALLLPTIMLFIRAIVSSAHSNLTTVKMQEAIKQSQEEEK